MGYHLPLISHQPLPFILLLDLGIMKRPLGVPVTFQFCAANGFAFAICIGHGLLLGPLHQKPSILLIAENR